LTHSKSIEIDLFTQFFLISTTDATLTSTANATKRNAIKVSTTRAGDVLSSQESVAVEVSSAVVRIGKETCSCALEASRTAGTFNTIRWHAIATSEHLANWTSEDAGKEHSRWAVPSHTDVKNVGIQWPRPHVTDVVASELITTTNLAVKRK
jgi:hypothetical protein